MLTFYSLGNDDLSLPKGMYHGLLFQTRELSRSELQYLAVGFISAAEVVAAAVHAAKHG
jgi:hypothetical protein